MRSGAGLAAGLAGVVLSCASCGGEQRPPASLDLRGPKITTVELAAFEVRADNVDRFEHCPPPGEIGQDWVPPIPDWHAPLSSTSAAIPESAVEASGGGSGDAGASVTASTGGDAGGPSAAGDEGSRTPATLTALIDEAATQTRRAFRNCYHHGLLYDPTQDGHAAFVLRVDHSGQVSQVEVWGACDLAHEALVCMRDEASHVKLDAPAGGFATVTVPAVFTSGREQHRAPNDAYAAAAYVALESMRPRLHRCEETERRAGASVFASALLTIDIDAKGRGVHVGVDQWKGTQELLACAAEALRDASFPPPPAGQGRVVLPLVFNPRPYTR
jgi:hypothetical protein